MCTLHLAIIGNITSRDFTQLLKIMSLGPGITRMSAVVSAIAKLVPWYKELNDQERVKTSEERNVTT